MLKIQKKALRFWSSNELLLVWSSKGIIVIPNQLHLEEKEAEKCLYSLKKPVLKLIFSN